MIDIGLNLANGQFRDDAEAVLARARSAGVQKCVLTGTDIDSSRRVLGLCRHYAGAFPGMLWSTAGIHPHDADRFDAASIAALEQLLREPEVVAIGETGLDFNRNYSSRDNQVSAFRAQVELAIELDTPLFLHERDAFETQYKILEPHRQELPPAVAHCFTGSRESLEGYLELGLYIGITGWICDERRGAGLRDIVGLIPDDRLLVETDAPFLLPHNIRPKPESRRNEPMYLHWVVEKIAECRNEDPDRIAELTSDNAKRLFGLEA